MATTFAPSSLEPEDIYAHLKHNILNPQNNCQDILNEDTYYCINCKQSTCPNCNLQSHKDKQHNVIQKEKILFLDDSFLSPIETSIQQAKHFQTTKAIFISDFESKINTLHGIIEQIKQQKIKEINEMYNSSLTNLNELESNYNEMKTKLKNYFDTFTSFFAIKENNNDTNNTLFLMNYEIASLLNMQNKKLIQGLNDSQDQFTSYQTGTLSQLDKIKDDINNVVHLTKPNFKLDDYYWDVKRRIKSYEDNIKGVQKTIYEILRKNGTYEALNDLVGILDSKNKKGVDYIFNQNFFSQSNQTITPRNENELNNTNRNKYLTRTPSEKKYNLRSPKTRSHSKSKANNNTNSNSKTQTPNITIYHQNNANLSPGHSKLTHSPSSKKLSKTNSFKNILAQLNIKSPSQINLDNQIKQSFYTYAVIDMYNKQFTTQPRHSFDNSTRIFENYNLKQHTLKEAVKPIIGTSEIVIYDSSTNTSIKKKLHLDKERHGYTAFPQGLRHIFVNGKLYITGGVDALGNPINTVLMFDSATYEIKQISPMNVGHCYHSIEVLDNYDCIIVIGGEKSKVCELFDLFTSKWTRLPNLNYPRANVNIYFDQYTSDVYAMFGSTGLITSQRGYSDVIEVLELKDVSSGWIKVDYYKSASIDLKMGYVSVVPFTSDKLLIIGCKLARENSNKANNALFLMKKNEIVKVSQDILDEMKIKESKTKQFSNISQNTSQLPKKHK